MVAELSALGRRAALPPLEVVDVDSDPDLQRRHGLQVPVLLLAPGRLAGTAACPSI
jgi:hypothetical protein